MKARKQNRIDKIPEDNKADSYFTFCKYLQEVAYKVGSKFKFKFKR